MDSKAGAKSSGFRSFSRTTIDSVWSQTLRLSSLKCSVGSERSSVQGLPLSQGADCNALVFRGHLQEEGWVWGHGRGGPDSEI